MSMTKETRTAVNLEDQGWKLACISGGTHFKRTLDMYKELGIEVHIEKIEPEQCGSCTKCYEEGNEDIYRIYTKPLHE
jgi:hypothetical protein